jgi:hypothetical protein
MRYESPTRLFDPGELLPPRWLQGRSPTGFFIFNPAIIRCDGRLLMAYRIDFGRESATRVRVACAICALDQNWRVMSGSVVALSDSIVDGGENHYDPRFLIFRGRLYIHYNNNWDSVPNQIFLVELDADSLQVRSAARPLLLDGPRQKIEKNWMLFDHEGDLFAIYQIAPHIVLRLGFGGHGPVLCKPEYISKWDTAIYTRHFGMPRGGTPPVLIGKQYISVFHSRTQLQRLAPATLKPTLRSLDQKHMWRLIKRWLREQLFPLKIYGGVYGFAATPPFAPIFIRPDPVLRPEHEERRRRPTASHLTPRSVVFPTGLVQLNGGSFLVSYGVHDERCVLRILERNICTGHHINAAQEI